MRVVACRSVALSSVTVSSSPPSLLLSLCVVHTHRRRFVGSFVGRRVVAAAVMILPSRLAPNRIIQPGNGRG